MKESFVFHLFFLIISFLVRLVLCVTSTNGFMMVEGVSSHHEINPGLVIFTLYFDKSSNRKKENSNKTSYDTYLIIIYGGSFPSGSCSLEAVGQIKTEVWRRLNIKSDSFGIYLDGGRQAKNATGD